MTEKGNFTIIFHNVLLCQKMRKTSLPPLKVQRVGSVFMSKKFTAPGAKLIRKVTRKIMAKEYRLSPERYEELKQELVYLKTVREKEVAEQIKEARSFGDLSENSEYDEAKNEQGKLYSRMAEVENILANCVVVEEEEQDGTTVHMGSTVVVLDKEFDEELTYKIVGSQEADPMNGCISEDSPFGKALLGRSKGEDVVVDAPAGQIHYQILDVKK